ncbi:hypothetical protein JHK82_021292 [Glycine max]|nr:hypothetical protein JHK82_021292 [Glycine max]
MSVTNGLRAKLRVMLMHGFQSLRDKFLMEKMISRSLKVEFMVAAAGKTDIDNADLGVRHEEVIMDIQRSLNMLDQIFVDIAILVETQGENLDSIEDRVASEEHQHRMALLGSCGDAADCVSLLGEKFGGSGLEFGGCEATFISPLTFQ